METLSDHSPATPAECGFASWQCTGRLDRFRYDAIVREMALTGAKWDAQIGDQATLASFALVASRREWTQLARLAEALSAELNALEQQLVQRPDLWPRLGLPAAIVRALDGDEPLTPTAARVVRYDFHPTPAGWAISEVNSDVPGGFNEAGPFTRLMAENFPGCQPAGDPLATLATALARAVGDCPHVAFLTAPGCIDDLQVAAGLAARLREHGVQTHQARPEQLEWRQQRARLRRPGGSIPLGGIHRFYQGEWLADLPGEKWRPLLRGGITPVCNPATAVLSESKRLPLLWPELDVPLETWRSLLPETRPVRNLLRSGGRGWILKPAYCNTGQTIVAREWQGPTDFMLSALPALLRSGAWSAQRRFATQTIATPDGPRYPCIGVYTIDGKAAGIYARLSGGPIVDYAATDVAVLFHE